MSLLNCTVSDVGSWNTSKRKSKVWSDLSVRDRIVWGTIKNSRYALKATAIITFLVKFARNDLATLSEQVLLYKLLYIENFHSDNFIKYR